jgi:hypothetical protein
MWDYPIIVNSIGLVMDIIGATLLFFFGLPPDIRRDGKYFLVINSGNRDEISKAKKYDAYSRGALYLLGGGFILQLVSNFI